MDEGRVGIELLGGVVVRGPNGSGRALSGHLARVVTALALARGPLSTESLIDTVWEEVPRSGRNALHRHMSRLRKVLDELDAGHVLETEGYLGYGLVRSAVRVDVDELAILAAAGFDGLHLPGVQGGGPRYWLEPWPSIDCLALEGRRAHVALLCQRAREAARRQLEDRSEFSAAAG